MSLQNRQNLAQEIADEISERIIRMEIAPGERILEAGIARELNVSYSPVREAMRILERYRLVELVPRRGARVTEVSEKYVGWLFDIMIDFLGLIARLCSENRTDEDLDQMIAQEKKAAALAVADDFVGHLRAFSEFAQTALKATGNPLLEQMIGDWFPGLRRAYFLSLSRSSYKLQESAGVLREAKQHIIEGNGEAASKVVQSYARLEKERVLEIIRKHAAPDERKAGAQHVSDLR